MSPATLLSRIETREARLAIIGLGYVGLPLAVEFGRHFPVVGFDISARRLEELRASLVNGRKEGFGLRTVHQRIQILFGAEYGLTVESTPDVGTKIRVEIPMKTNEKEMGE